MLLSVEKEDTYDYLRGKNKYQVVLNKTEDTKIFYANTTFDYNNAKDRDEQYESLKTRLEAFRIKFF